MNRSQALRLLKENLHISFSQINTYLTCSLKYYFQYVMALPPERVSSSLILGSAVHAALARYYEIWKTTGNPEKPEVLRELFHSHLEEGAAQAQAEIIFKKEAPDLEALSLQGEALLKVFAEEAPQGLYCMEVVAVELPLAARLRQSDGLVTDYDLVGVIDLLLRDRNGSLLAVDHKTSKNAYIQEAVDSDLQLAAYALLLTDNGFLASGEPLQGRFDVLRKLKTPKLERYLTLRNFADQARFSRISLAVLNGIEQEVYIPSTGWQCADCPFADACRAW